MVDSYHASDSEESDEDFTKFKSIDLKRLDIEIQLARDRNQYCLIFDKSGQAATFFSYKANLKDFAKEVVANKIGKKLKKDSIELLRKSLVYSIKAGEVMVVNCDKTLPDFTKVYTHDKEFPTQKIFDYDLWNTRTEYMSIVKPDENKDLLGNHDCYLRNPNF